MIIALFSLADTFSLCQILAFDFAIKPETKILYSFPDNQIVFFSSITIYANNRPLSLAFRINISDNSSRFLLCYNKSARLSKKIDSNALSSFPIIKMKNQPDLLKTLDIPPDDIQYWAIVTKNFSDVLSYIRKNPKKFLILLERSKQYAFAISKSFMLISPLSTDNQDLSLLDLPVIQTIDLKFFYLRDISELCHQYVT